MDSSARANILAVDDEDLARSLLRLHLVRQGHTVRLASCVREAQAILSNDSAGKFDCVITDYLMPGESGLDLLAWLKNFDPCLAGIIVTSGGEKDLVTRSLRSGAVDFLDKPFRAEQLANAVQQAVTRTRRRRELAQTEAAAEAVGRAQQRLLSGSGRELPGRVLLRHHSAFTAGGDFFRAFELSPGELLVLAADVSGHDLKAAFVSAYFQGIVRGMLAKRTPVEEILAFFNHCLLDEWGGRGEVAQELPTSLAVCAAVVDQNRRQITLFNSGFPVAYLIDAEGNLSACGTGGGHPLGWFEDAKPDHHAAPMPTEGWLWMWTDGLEDHARNLGVSPWSLAWVLMRSPTQAEPHPTLQSIPDDILVACVPVGPTTMPELFPIVHESVAGSESPAIDQYQHAWARSLALALPALSSDRLTEILLCVREAVLNALIHGCGGRPEALAEISIVWMQKAGCLRARIADPGPGHQFDWQNHAEDAAEQLIPEHRGLSMIHAFADRVRAERSGATLLIEFDLKLLYET